MRIRSNFQCQRFMHPNCLGPKHILCDLKWKMGSLSCRQQTGRSVGFTSRQVSLIMQGAFEKVGGGVTYPSCGPAHSTCDYSGNPSPTDGQSKKKNFFQRAKLYVFIA